MGGADDGLVRRLRAALAERADPARGEAQQHYMKSAMPFLGLGSPQLRDALRPVLGPWRPPDRPTWEATVLLLWEEATHREERYAAIKLVRHRQARGWLDPEALPLLRHLVVTGAWWDLVDELATHPIGDVLAAYRPEVTPVMLGWADDRDLWTRRAAVLCQVGDKAETDAGLLRAVVEANAEDPTFWLRKAIGWALRDYARTDPDWVRAEVDRLGDRLSGLSRREALKHLGG
ncbi:DNA alkylation repair protein [Nocardioides ferulae]|uniref:DNA alkylation repair protein n=1 Tax=Nocardioides ferulae TaxID=2340821 RepID=UPI000EAE1314|nr:DNA alkylation repair protein [Nocardioides ferulae]